ncbi:CocE/NonD family hydrolase [Streptomyces geranii]|uniref:CocE/NonD family hydrolase n=1 Tax=Streptomyces geranii TaxID=2058923 RepID=UPI000D0382AE|nr:CocE/NonD family hydrolase [Streptomyces geranii]
MNLRSHLLQRLLGLGPPVTRDLVVRRDLRVPMGDGVELLADRWVARGREDDGLPVALIRTPYGRRGIQGGGSVRLLAERGFQVVVQSARGTFGSGGDFEPFRHERADGLSTLEWVVKQPWCAGSVVLVGASYMGFAQWAVADSLPPEVKAMIPMVTESALTLEFLRPDGFSLETPFEWGVMVAGQERPFAVLRQLAQAPRNRRALAGLPLGGADLAALGHRSDYLQSILAHDTDGDHDDQLDHRHRVTGVSVPVSSIGGWYDIFLPGQLRDFRALQEAGRPARLTVGPWAHLSPHGTPIREAVEFGLAHARGQTPPERAPVRLFVMGAGGGGDGQEQQQERRQGQGSGKGRGKGEWRDFDSWPPVGYAPRRFHLGSGGVLGDGAPGEAAAHDSYRYDPAEPTPAVGGVRMGRGSGRVANGELEARGDVLTYTTAELTEDVEVVGEVGAEIWFRSSLAYADVFVRVCDVDARGRSFNVCDGLVSVTGADELAPVHVSLWPTAYRFRRGHRIRVQVSSGAFPRFARNTGTGEPHATATVLLAADQEVHHGGGCPSAVVLPVREQSSPQRPVL